MAFQSKGIDNKWQPIPPGLVGQKGRVHCLYEDLRAPRRTHVAPRPGQTDVQHSTQGDSVSSAEYLADDERVVEEAGLVDDNTDSSANDIRAAPVVGIVDELPLARSNAATNRYGITAKATFPVLQPIPPSIENFHEAFLNLNKSYVNGQWREFKKVPRARSKIPTVKPGTLAPRRQNQIRNAPAKGFSSDQCNYLGSYEDLMATKDHIRRQKALAERLRVEGENETFFLGDTRLEHDSVTDFNPDRSDTKLEEDLLQFSSSEASMSVTSLEVEDVQPTKHIKPESQSGISTGSSSLLIVGLKDYKLKAKSSPTNFTGASEFLKVSQPISDLIDVGRDDDDLIEL